MLNNKSWLDIGGVDTAENGPSKVCQVTNTMRRSIGGARGRPARRWAGRFSAAWRCDGEAENEDGRGRGRGRGGRERGGVVAREGAMSKVGHTKISAVMHLPAKHVMENYLLVISSNAIFNYEHISSYTNVYIAREWEREEERRH